MVQNNTSTSQFAEVDITLTKLGTGQEITLVPVLTGTVPAKGILRLKKADGAISTYSLATNAVPVGPGTYTVSFPVFDGNGIKLDQVLGPYPLRVGTEEESLNVAPGIINLGLLPPGRYMYPIPVEVRWTAFLTNRQNMDQPFTIRIYTDNAARFQGVQGALHKTSPAGLISSDGKYVIPLRVWNLNYGPDSQETGWDAKLAGPPPVDEDDTWLGPPLIEGKRNTDASSWVRIPDFSEMNASPASWRRLIGQDPTDTRYVTESNPTGDFTLKSPFTFYLATEVGPTAVEGQYSTTLVVELWSP